MFGPKCGKFVYGGQRLECPEQVAASAAGARGHVMGDERNPIDPLPQAYQRLRTIAQRLMNDERNGHTLSATDVVHEAMAKLMAAGWSPSQEDEAELNRFLRHGVRAMNEVLIDYARRRSAAKRGGDGRARRVQLKDLDDLQTAISRDDHVDWSGLFQTMEQLEKVDPRRHAVVSLRFFGGLHNEQIARQLGVDVRTVRRDWTAARAWLCTEIRKRLS
jgi:RNA polymerase sigma factor (TIGR02999 family)